MSPVPDTQLERQGRRLTGSGVRWLLAGTLLGVPGVVLVVVGLVVAIRWMWPVGIALLLLASVPLFVAFALLSSGAVSRWAARRKLFA
jgi:hypothetical protein